MGACGPGITGGGRKFENETLDYGEKGKVSHPNRPTPRKSPGPAGPMGRWEKPWPKEKTMLFCVHGEKKRNCPGRGGLLERLGHVPGIPEGNPSNSSPLEGRKRKLDRTKKSNGLN